MDVMETILTFLIMNWASIFVVIGFLIVCYIMIKNGYRQNIALWIYFIVCKVEKEYGDGMGEYKYQDVLDSVYHNFPNIIKFIFTEKEIDIMIESAVLKMKEWLLNQSK